MIVLHLMCVILQQGHVFTLFPEIELSGDHADILATIIPWRGVNHEQVLHPERGEPPQKVLHLRQHRLDVFAGLALDDRGGLLELAHSYHIALFSHLTQTLSQEHLQLHQQMKPESCVSDRKPNLAFKHLYINITVKNAIAPQQWEHSFR